jgi:HD-GYP domain-containing protein (c-di-GMP phosphodiesterase class II)
MVMVDRAVLNQPARLTPDDQSKVRAHPQLGYEMLRKLRPNEVLANHAAFQHHERQDGTGYPRGLHGNNRVHRGGVDRSAAGRIVLDAEVAAVADIYDALGSDRPYRPALPPDQVVRTMRRLAGGHLNREIVAQLIALLPVYPLGAEVVVMTGRYRHYRGIIARIHRDDPDHPTVRLLANAERLRIPAVELDLRAVDEVIACVPLTGPEAGQG